MQNYISKFIYFIPLILISCSEVSRKDDPVIARVFDKVLYQSELDKLSSLKANDRLQHKKIVSDWINEQILIVEGEEKISDKHEIESLVKAYKSSLIKSQFEEFYVENNLKENISVQEIQNYFDENKTTFTNNMTHVRAMIAKIPASHSGLILFSEMWNNSRTDQIESFCQENSAFCLINPDTLYASVNLKVLLPKSLHKALKKESTIREKNGEFEYFVKTLEVYDNNSEKALEVHKANIIQSILFARKRQLLIHLRDSLYNEAVEKNKIKIFIDE